MKTRNYKFKRFLAKVLPLKFRLWVGYMLAKRGVKIQCSCYANPTGLWDVFCAGFGYLDTCNGYYGEGDGQDYLFPLHSKHWEKFQSAILS